MWALSRRLINRNSTQQKSTWRKLSPSFLNMARYSCGTWEGARLLSSSPSLDVPTVAKKSSDDLPPFLATLRSNWQLAFKTGIRSSVYIFTRVLPNANNIDLYKASDGGSHESPRDVLTRCSREPVRPSLLNLGRMRNSLLVTCRHWPTQRAVENTDAVFNQNRCRRLWFDQPQALCEGVDWRDKTVGPKVTTTAAAIECFSDVIGNQGKFNTSRKLVVWSCCTCKPGKNQCSPFPRRNVPTSFPLPMTLQLTNNNWCSKGDPCCLGRPVYDFCDKHVITQFAVVSWLKMYLQWIHFWRWPRNQVGLLPVWFVFDGEQNVA
jgi:hypothetical protein